MRGGGGGSVAEGRGIGSCRCICDEPAGGRVVWCDTNVCRVFYAFASLMCSIWFQVVVK